MADVSDFLVCSFCGRPSSSEEVDFIIRSQFGKSNACVCNKCIIGLHVLLNNCYAGMMDDENNYTLD